MSLTEGGLHLTGMNWGREWVDSLLGHTRVSSCSSGIWLGRGEVVLGKVGFGCCRSCANKRSRIDDKVIDEMEYVSAGPVLLCGMLAWLMAVRCWFLFFNLGFCFICWVYTLLLVLVYLCSFIHLIVLCLLCFLFPVFFYFSTYCFFYDFIHC